MTTTIDAAGRAEADRLFDEHLGWLLRVGVVVSALVVLAGGVVYLARHGHETADYHVFQGEPSGLRSVTGVLSALGTGGGREIVQLGLILLVATPIARVVFSLFVFTRERNWLYVAVTAAVLALLIVSLGGR